MDKVLVKMRRTEAAQKLPSPSYATAESAGADLAAAESCLVLPGERRLVGTGVFLEIPRGCEIQVRPRSGLALRHGVTVLNSPGTIDSDYRGEIKVIIVNHGSEPFRIEPGDRIAQMVLQPVLTMDFLEEGELSETERGAGGFGSTG